VIVSGEIRLVAGQRLAEGDAVSLAVVNAMFSGMTGRVVPGSVGARELADGCITAAKLSDAVATELSVPDGSITTIKLADGCLSADDAGRAKMEDGFVTADQLAADAVETAKLADGAVTAGKLGGGINLQPLDNEQADHDAAQNSAVGTTLTAVMNVSITPSATGSRVLVLVSAMLYGAGVGAVFYKVTRQIGAGAESDLLVGDAAGSRTRVTGGGNVYVYNGANLVGGCSVNFPILDSPATVSAVTYRLYIASAATTCGLNSTSGEVTTSAGRQPSSSLIAVEVLA
jgi:hypothetical protein